MIVLTNLKGFIDGILTILSFYIDVIFITIR